MRKLKLQVQVTIDGFVAGKNGEMDWMVWDWDDALKDYVTKLTDSVDTILLGRKMTDGFISSWSSVASDPNNPEYESGKKFIEMPKFVFSNTLTESPWENTTLASGDLTEEVMTLKKQTGKDLIVYGGATFVSSLIKANLIDEYHLFVNPVILGQGMPIFANINGKRPLKLIKSIAFDAQIVLMHYQPEN